MCVCVCVCVVCVCACVCLAVILSYSVMSNFVHTSQGNFQAAKTSELKISLASVMKFDTTDLPSHSSLYKIIQYYLHC